MLLPTVAVFDTGLAGALDNAAIDRRDLGLRAQGLGCDQLRFYRSLPAASIGRHQALDRELRQDYCRRHGIDIVRRPTSGGALYLDSGQLGFSLVIALTETLREQPLASLLERGSKVVATSLRQFGMAAAAKAPNDVEIDGRKIASLYVARMDAALLLQGSVLLSIDIDTMLRVLQAPTEKLSPDGSVTDYAALLAQAGVMLVPYCAKPAWCDWRRRDGCDECGLCEVGTAYGLARERNLRVVSITNYEHLVATLAGMKADRTVAYVGMCCSHFFIKRYRAFAEAGVPALLMDISGANCYELLQEEQAYAGTFEAESKIDTTLLAQVMEFVPYRPA